MSYLKHIATISKFLDENHMENPIVSGVIPSYKILDDMCKQGVALMDKKELELEKREAAGLEVYHDKTISYITSNYYDPVIQLQEMFYGRKICECRRFIQGYRTRNGLPPLFYMDDIEEYTTYPQDLDTFPTQDRLTGAISHAFDMTKAEFRVYEQFRRECSERAKEHGVNGWTPEEREKARLMREQFEYTQNYAYRMIDVLEATYMS